MLNRAWKTPAESKVAALICVLVLGACQAGSGRGNDINDGDGALETPPAAEPEALTELQLQTIAELDGLFSRHRDVAVVCEEDASQRSPESPFPNCDVAIVDASGAVEMLGFDNVRNAQRLAGDHLLIVNRDHEMMVTDPAGSRLRSFDGDFTSPHVEPDGIHVLVLSHSSAPDGTASYSNIERVQAFSGVREVLVDDPSAYAPHAVPDSDRIVFVSARTGVASLWLREADGNEVQISNRAVTSAHGKGFKPVPVHELSWLPSNPRVAVYSAFVDDHHELFMLDTIGGRVDRIGPGRLPARRGDGRLLVVASGKGGVRAVPLPEELLPPPSEESEK